MDTTVRGIDAVVVAELRAAGYIESTVGQYAKTIKALTEFASGREYSTSVPEGSDFVALDAAWQAEMGRRGLGQVERAVPRFRPTGWIPVPSSTPPPSTRTPRPG